jgi:hypothetical protein
MDFHSNLWISMAINGFPRIFMDIHGYPLIFMDIRGSSDMCAVDL